MSAHRLPKSRVKPKRYGDYRNQMKLSRTSEEHRNRRNRQMAEAQRLLDHSCIPNNDATAIDQSHGAGKSVTPFYDDGADLTAKYEDSLHEAPRLSNSPTTHHVPQERRDDKIRYRSRTKESQGIQQFSSPIRNRYNQESIQTASDNFHRIDVEDKIFEPDQGIETKKSTIECPKIKQLKQRMLIRKERRRKRLMHTGEVAPPSSIKHENERHRNRNPPNHPRPIDDYSRFDDAEGDLDNKGHFGSRPTLSGKSHELNHHSNEDVSFYQATSNLNMNRTSHAIHPQNEKSSHNHSPKETPAFHSRTLPLELDERLGVGSDTESVVDIELVYCPHCQRSSAPATHKRFCQAFDESGVPKCIAMRNKKRKVYNSAKVRITNNKNLDTEDQRVVISGRKKVVSELRQKAKGKKKKKRSAKWRQESEEFRKAMETNRLIAKAEKEGRPAHYYL